MLKPVFLVAFSQENFTSAPEIAAAMALIATFFVLFLILALAVYLYTAFAWMAIAKKTRTKPAWLAFIPIANLYLLSKIARMHWWPILLLIGMFIPYVNLAAIVAFAVFMFIWNWKAFERVKRPGWWTLFAIIPVLGWIVFLVLLGVAAWGKR